MAHLKPIKRKNSIDTKGMTKPLIFLNHRIFYFLEGHVTHYVVRGYSEDPNTT